MHKNLLSKRPELSGCFFIAYKMRRYFMNYKRCMENKCKVCEKKLVCDKELKRQLLLTYRPFEEYFMKLKENTENEKH